MLSPKPFVVFISMNEKVFGHPRLSGSPQAVMYNNIRPETFIISLLTLF